MKSKKKETFREFKLPDRKQPIFRFFSSILFRPIFGVRTESMIEDLPDRAILVSIHAAKNGPMAISMSYPKFSAMWGHHAMLGSYGERFHYLRDVLYMQKMHKNKLVATLKASYEALFSIYIYRGMKVIGTYTDMRLIQTIRSSMEVLDAGAGIVIFPEDSSEGYFDEVRSAFAGFVMLSELYYQRSGEDVPVIPMYISTQKKRLLVGAPRYVHEMALEGLQRNEIADRIKDDINALYRDYIRTDAPLPQTVADAPTRDRTYYGEV